MYTREDKQFMYSIFPLTILKDKKKNLSAVDCCTCLSHVLLIPLLCRATSVSLMFDEGRQIFIQMHRHSRSIS